MTAVLVLREKCDPSSDRSPTGHLLPQGEKDRYVQSPNARMITAFCAGVVAEVSIFRS